MKNASPKKIEVSQKQASAMAFLKQKVLAMLLGGLDAEYYKRRMRFIPGMIDRIKGCGARSTRGAFGGAKANARRLAAWKLHCDQCNAAAELRRQERKMFGHVITVR